MKEDSGNLHWKAFVTLFTLNFSKFFSLLLFSLLILYHFYTRVAQQKLSSVLCTHGQISLESKSKTKYKRPRWRVRKQCNCISQTDSMDCQVFSRHHGQGELQEGIWIRTMNRSERSLIGIHFFKTWQICGRSRSNSLSMHYRKRGQKSWQPQWRWRDTDEF